MSFNGSGTFVVNTAGQPVVPNTVISATAFNALTADLANGLSTCITKDGQTTPTANIPMGNNKITGLAAGTAGTDAANLSQVQGSTAKLLQSVTGTDTITAAMVPALTSYSAGQMFYFVAAGDNTGAVTINIDSLGAKSVTRDGSTALVAGDITNGKVVVIVYDGTRFQLLNSNAFTNLYVSGNLGVGTASPAYRLHVATGGNNYIVSQRTTANTSALLLGAESGGTSIYSWTTVAGSTGVPLNFYTGASPSMTLDTSGNLGLGTTTNALTYALTLYATGSTSRYMAVGNSNTGLNGTLFGIDGSGNTAINNTQNLAMLFLTNNTECGRFTAGGYFKASNSGTYDNATGSYHEIRQTTNNATVLVSNTVASFTGANIQSGVYGTVAGTGFSHIGCLNSVAATVFQVRGDGNAYNTNGTYGTISDERLKQDIVDADSQWDDIKAVRFRKYRMKADVEINPDTPAMFGLVAQELEQTSPGLVDELVDRDAEGNDLGTKTKSVKTSILLMKAAKALQEAMARIESLEAKVAALEAK